MSSNDVDGSNEDLTEKKGRWVEITEETFEQYDLPFLSGLSETELRAKMEEFNAEGRPLQIWLVD